jgi:hypothetical protein
MTYEYDPSEPHYVIGINQGAGPQWRQQHPNRDDAQRWLNEYPVSASYKSDHYRVVSVREYWERHKTDWQKRRPYAL